MKRIHIFSWFLVLAAILVWAVFGYLVWRLQFERARYDTLLSDIALGEQRERATTRLRGAIRDSHGERQLLDTLIDTDLIAAVSTIEGVGRESGTVVTIENASSAHSSETVHTVSISGSAEGRLQAILKTLQLFETLPFPAVIDSLSIEAAPATITRPEDHWRMTFQLRFVTTSAVGI